MRIFLTRSGQFVILIISLSLCATAESASKIDEDSNVWKLIQGLSKREHENVHYLQEENIYSSNDDRVPSLEWQGQQKHKQEDELQPLTDSLRLYRNNIVPSRTMLANQQQRRTSAYTNKLKKESEEFLEHLFTAKRKYVNTKRHILNIKVSKRNSLF
jgi:uncharacterized protein YfaP (DUF2135 family)